MNDNSCFGLVFLSGCSLFGNRQQFYLDRHSFTQSTEMPKADYTPYMSCYVRPSLLVFRDDPAIELQFHFEVNQWTDWLRWWLWFVDSGNLIRISHSQCPLLLNLNTTSSSMINRVEWWGKGNGGDDRRTTPWWEYKAPLNVPLSIHIALPIRFHSIAGASVDHQLSVVVQDEIGLLSRVELIHF